MFKNIAALFAIALLALSLVTANPFPQEDDNSADTLKSDNRHRECKLPYQEWDHDKRKCVCKKGYELVHNKCVKKCPRYSHREGDKCKCDKGFEFNHDDSKCIKKCPRYSHREGDKCKCIEGYEFNHDDSKCIKKCPHGQERKGDKCVCKDDNKHVDPHNRDKCICRKDKGYEEDRWGNCKKKKDWKREDDEE